MFHDAVESDRLAQVLAKFHSSDDPDTFIKKQVLSFDPLSEGWERKLLEEVQSLIRLLSSRTLLQPIELRTGEPDYGTAEMFELRAELFDLIWDAMNSKLSDAQRSFLNDFFYGIDFTHWTKWAVLLLYTDIDLRIPTILRARRNGVDFAISGGALIYKKSGKSVPS
jgi:hypothetical protein